MTSSEFFPSETCAIVGIEPLLHVERIFAAGLAAPKTRSPGNIDKQRSIEGSDARRSRSKPQGFVRAVKRTSDAGALCNQVRRCASLVACPGVNAQVAIASAAETRRGRASGWTERTTWLRCRASFDDRSVAGQGEKLIPTGETAQTTIAR